MTRKFICDIELRAAMDISWTEPDDNDVVAAAAAEAWVISWCGWRYAEGGERAIANLPVYCAGQSPGTVPRHVRICRKQHAIVTNRCKFMPNWVTVHLRPALLHQSVPFKLTELHDLNHWVVLLMKLFIFGVNSVILIKIIWLYRCGASYFIVIFILFGSLSSLCVGLCLCFLLYFAANIWPNKLCMHCSWNHEIAACRYSALADYP